MAKLKAFNHIFHLLAFLPECASWCHVFLLQLMHTHKPHLPSLSFFRRNDHCWSFGGGGFTCSTDWFVTVRSFMQQSALKGELWHMSFRTSINFSCLIYSSFSVGSDLTGQPSLPTHAWLYSSLFLSWTSLMETDHCKWKLPKSAFYSGAGSDLIV